MKQWIKAIGTGRKGSRDLTKEEAEKAAHALACGEATEAQAAALLMGLRMKGETDDELLSFIEAYRRHLQPFAAFHQSVNCAGPYDGRDYFPVTIPVSLLLASVGVPHVLHGSDSLPPKRGTSMKDLLASLGVRVDLTAAQFARIMASLHIGFIATDRACPALEQLRPVREQLGMRTLINTVEKVLNPAASRYLIVGVHHRTAMEHLVYILPRAGFKKAYIVQGMEGSEDVPIFRRSAIRKVTRDGDEMAVLDPETFGFAGEPLPKNTAAEQFRQLKLLLQGEDTREARNLAQHVIFNAGLRLYWFDRVNSYEDGFRLAESLLLRRAPQKLLDRWVQMSSDCETFEWSDAR